MSNHSLAIKSTNAALFRINGGSTRGIIPQEDIRTTAAKNTSSVDNSAEFEAEMEETIAPENHKTLWYAAGISLAFVLLLLLALKFKWIRL